jgi:hypothetical protein
MNQATNQQETGSKQSSACRLVLDVFSWFTCSSEILVHFHWTTPQRIPGDLDSHHCATLRSNLFIYDLFKDVFGRSDLLANDEMINGREGIRKETTVDQFEGNIVPASWRD